MTGTTSLRKAVRWRVRCLWRFLVYLGQRFGSDHCLRAAAALAYTSLLALVPLFTVVFISLAAFPAFHGWREVIEGFVFQHFVPAVGEQVHGYLLEFSAKARGLQAFGVALLLLTVLAMLSTIESTFNVIWGVRRRRPLWVRLLIYSSVLSLGPILIGSGMVLTSSMLTLPLMVGRLLDISIALLALLPLTATTLAFVLLFKLIPYRPVPIRHALLGGVVASILFEIAKHGFAVFVTRFPAQQAIYGSFAVVPMFLTWIYLSWVIVLLGAEITQCLATFRMPRGRQPTLPAADDPLYRTCQVLLQLHAAQGRGESLSIQDLRRLVVDGSYAEINAALETLDKAGWINRDDKFAWLLARDLNGLSLRDLFRLMSSCPWAADVAGLASAIGDE